MIYHLMVWEKTAGTNRIVGEMISEVSDGGRTKSAFRYDREYLEHDYSFALDPVSLPLKPDHFSTDRSGVFGVFEDSLPDDWGRKLLVRKLQIPRHDQNLPNLLLVLGNAGLGALSFSSQGAPAPPPSETSITFLSDLVIAAEAFEYGEIQESELALLFRAGSSPGGARPKAVVYDKENDIHYIAKFPSIKDQVDVVKIEAATMLVAAGAGLDVPDTRLIQCAKKSILLVRRFDVIPTGRRHMISFHTLLKAAGYYQARYQELLLVIRKHSSNPLVDSERLYRQMVFNAVMGNTDDHLKNFWMIYDREQGWRLSPAFDLVPDIGQNGEHVLLFDIGSYNPGRSKLENIGRQWGIRNADVVVSQVFDAVGDWKDKFASTGVSDNNIKFFKEIDRNLVAP